MKFLKKLFRFPSLKRKEKGVVPSSEPFIDMPSFCLLVVNKQCNFRCQMCNMWKQVADPKQITIDEMKKFVIDLREFVHEPIFIHLIGGETLLWPHTPEMAKFITDVGFKTSITTNGWLIDKHMAKRLVDSKMSGVFISLDSLDECKHDEIRGVKGAYQHVMDAIDNLYEARGTEGPGEDGLSIGVTFTIMNQNMEEVIPFVEWVEKNPKIDAVFFNAVMQPFDSGEDSKEWTKEERYRKIWPGDTKMIHEILDALKQKRKKEPSKICNPVKQIDVLKEYFVAPYRFRQNLKIKCTRGDLAPEINAFGDISMCFYMPPLGNIRTHSIKKLWTSDEMKEVRHKINNCNLECDLAVNCFYKIENIEDYI